MLLAPADVDPGSIPDFIEPVEAWRVWRVGMRDGRVVLESLFTGTAWEPGVPLAAACARGHRPRWHRWRTESSAHTAPDPDCSCGIYGVRSVAAARWYLESRATLYRDERVIGRVALWGDVVESELGWRAARAYPVELFVPAPGATAKGLRRRVYVDEIVLALEAYRVPVDTVEAGVLTLR